MGCFGSKIVDEAVSLRLIAATEKATQTVDKVVSMRLKCSQMLEELSGLSNRVNNLINNWPTQKETLICKYKSDCKFLRSLNLQLKHEALRQKEKQHEGELASWEDELSDLLKENIALCETYTRYAEQIEKQAEIISRSMVILVTVSEVVKAGCDMARVTAMLVDVELMLRDVNKTLGDILVFL